MNRIEKCEQVFKALFKGEPSTMEDGNDPELMIILQRFIFGEVFETGMLDKKTRELLTVVCLTAMQTLPQLKAHTQGALNAGNSPLEIREAVYQCAPFIGFPRTLNAVSVIDEVFLANGISLPLPAQGTAEEDRRYEKGLAIQSPLYGNEIREKYADLPDGMGEALPRFLTEVCFGDFYTRGILSVQERELLMLAVLAALGADTQIKAHVIGNLKAGNKKEDLYAAMIQCLPYIGFPAAFNAINMIKSIES
ncbi:MAG: 4-carboxymuconolactone decarboxylase [Lachnospiraceae bacterium]|nr:4-carboxymuconolactone decarboxylase [Lachnospiraceae bacterium]